MKKYLISLMPARVFLFPLLIAFSFVAPHPLNAKYDFLKKQETVVAQVADSKPLSAEFVSFEEQLREGEPFYVGIRIDVQKGWKTYWKNPGESGFPLEIEWTLPPGYRVEEILWPAPEKSIVQDQVVYGYGEAVTVLAKLVAGRGPPDAIKADIKWLVCNSETCLPGIATLQFDRSKKGDLGAALSKMPRELADVEVQGVIGDKVSLLIPKKIYQEVPQQIEFFPLENSLREVITFRHDAEKGLFLEVPVQEKTLSGVLYFMKSKGVDAFLVDLPLQATPFNVERNSFMMVLLFAFVGGLILNLMPCVLPVVSLKVLSFISMARQSRRMTMLHGALFSAGVLASFWALAGVILVLRELGHSVGWGFQLQNEAFVGILAALLLLLALWLFGVFEVGFALSAKSGDAIEKAKKSDKGKLFGSFLSGVLATAVATPCSGPFLGTALGVAVTVPAMQSLLIFTMLGLGMASPYLLLAAFPALLRFMPKPGAWMETFKQLMGFMMLLVVIWLIWVFISQSSTSALLPLLVGFLMVSFGAWTYGKLTHGFKQFATKAVLLSVTFFSLVGGFYSIIGAGYQVEESVLSKGVEPGWEKFSKASLEQLRSEGKGVFIDFTAKWCLLCQANLIVLNMPEVDKQMKRMGVVKMMADWTKSDPEITQALAQFGRNSVPLYIYYPPGKNSKPQVLPQVLTKDLVLDSLGSRHLDDLAELE